MTVASRTVDGRHESRDVKFELDEVAHVVGFGRAVSSRSWRLPDRPARRIASKTASSVPLQVALMTSPPRRLATTSSYVLVLTR